MLLLLPLLEGLLASLPNPLAHLAMHRAIRSSCRSHPVAHLAMHHPEARQRGAVPEEEDAALLAEALDGSLGEAEPQP